MDNLNEEIQRIKKLFGEDLLWGNLIKEQGIVNPDLDSDGNIDASEFATSGNEISSQEAVSFLRNVDYAVQKASSRENIAGTCFNDKTLNTMYKWLVNDKPGGFNINDYKAGFNSNSGICYLYIQGPDVRGAVREIQKLNFWSDEDLTFLFKLEADINFTSKAAFSATSTTTPGAATTLVNGIFLSSGNMKNTLIRYVRYKCKYDPTSKQYSNMKFAGFFNDKKARVMETVEETLSEGLKYHGFPTTGVEAAIQGPGTSILEVAVGGTTIPLEGPITGLLQNIEK